MSFLPLAFLEIINNFVVPLGLEMPLGTTFDTLINTNMTNLFYLVPAAAVIALLFAYIFFRQMMKESEGTATMKQIAQFVREGAMAYLKQQYKVVIVVFVVLAALFAVLAWLGVQNCWVPFAFLTGGFFSGLAGFVGMKTATYASARTANAAQRSLNS